MIRKLFLIYTVIKLCDGQVLSELFPRVMIKNTAAELQEPVTVPIVRSFEANAKSLAATVTKLSKQVKFSFDQLLATTSKKQNAGNKTDQFVADFNSGVGNVDAQLSFMELTFKYGIESERHGVITEDGYELSMFRIPGNGPTVFLMHGLLGSADDFIIAGPKTGLAYLLAENGYDVWLGNARGNKYSRRHMSLNPLEATFWDFSWHEIGVSDLPHMIDYVLAKTNQKSLKYIGYSQGTTVFLVMMSVKPQYNKRVSIMIALSPVALMGRVRSPVIRLLSPSSQVLQELSINLDQHEFLPNSKFRNMLKQIVCGPSLLSDMVCNNVFFLMAGFDFTQLNATNLPVVFGHLPSGASMKQFTHYGQGILSEDLRYFDYGSMENSERYGTMEPPCYNTDKIETPISVFFGDSDWLADPQDVALLCDKLKSVIDIYRVPYKMFNHVDFILAKDVKRLVYKRLLHILSMF